MPGLAVGASNQRRAERGPVTGVASSESSSGLAWAVAAREAGSSFCLRSRRETALAASSSSSDDAVSEPEIESVRAAKGRATTWLASERVISQSSLFTLM